MDLNRKGNHSGLVDIKVNMICIFIIVSWPLILHVRQKCNADSTIRTLYMLELSLLKIKKKSSLKIASIGGPYLTKTTSVRGAPPSKFASMGGPP